MVRTLPFSNLYSHPDKPLEEHLIGTAEIALRNLNSSPVHKIADFRKEALKKVLLVSGLCHDLGKATSYFQTYLLGSKKEKKELRQKPETRHGLLSAVSAYYAANCQLASEVEDGEERAFLSFLAFLIVRRHHGNLGHAVGEIFISSKNAKLLAKQVESIEEKKLVALNAHLQNAGLIQAISKPLLAEWVASVKDDLKKHRPGLRRLGKAKNLSYYLTANFLFSLLIDADKSEVVLGEYMSRKELDFDASVIDKYKTILNFKPTKINNIREKAYQEVIKQPIDLGNRVLSINLPTGLGKTLTSFAFAFNLRESIRQKRNFCPRIIYALPFLSVIDQNADEIEKVLTCNGLKTDTNLLLKHHHLAEVYYREDGNEFEPSQAKILIEGWNSEIIITTFVQLFHTLISGRNKSLRKFHRLSGSIIILDEVQSIPSKYWLLIKNIFQLVTQELNSYLVFVTATEPLIFERQEVQPLVDRDYYFEKMDRVVMEAKLDKEQTIEEFVDCLALEYGKSYLFILNTINSAKLFYERFTDKIGEEAAFLSTHVTPFERLKRINEMRTGKVKFAVSTQLVEAGVDIDFDVVYRDLAPLDAINQAAGRCNRNWSGEGEKGKIIIISLKDENRLYAHYIYDVVLLEITKSILLKKREIRESEFLEIINDYYMQVQEKKSSDASRLLLEAVSKMKYDSVDETACIKDFRLISQEYQKIDIFIEINEEAKEIWRKYSHIKKIENLFKRRLAFDQIKADFYKFTISVPLTVKNLPPEVSGFRYVNHNSLNEYYHRTTGFKPLGVLSIW